MARTFAIGITVQHPLFDRPLLHWMGLMTIKPRTEDYVPLFPWFGLLLIGAGAGAWIARERRTAERLGTWKAPRALVGRRSLARVSQTPGKTQLLNIYQLPSLYLIDLPGYGFAQADKGTRLAYRKLLESFLRKRTTLTGVVWLLDIRHKPSKDDGDFHTLLTDSGCAVLAVLTKADKLTRSGRAKAAAERADAIGFPLDQVQVVSAETGLGIAELGASLLAAAMEPITPEPAA